MNGRAMAICSNLARAFAAVCLLTGCQAVQTQQAVDVLATQPARCADPGQQSASGIAFRSEADWNTHLAGIGGATRAAMSSWRVDFPAGQSVALVDAGPLPNPGYRVSVRATSLPIKDQTLYVRLVVVPPAAGRVQAQVIAFACVYLHLGPASYRKIEIQADQAK